MSSSGSSGQPPSNAGDDAGATGAFRRRPISARLPDWLDTEVRELAVLLDIGPSTMLRRVVEEWWVLCHTRHLEFRMFPYGRCAALRRGPEVWAVISWGRTTLPNDTERFMRRLSWLASRDALEEVLMYEDLFPEEVDRMRRLGEAAERGARGR